MEFIPVCVLYNIQQPDLMAFKNDSDEKNKDVVIASKFGILIALNALLYCVKMPPRVCREWFKICIHPYSLNYMVIIVLHIYNMYICYVQIIIRRGNIVHENKSHEIPSHTATKGNNNSMFPATITDVSIKV